MATKAGLRTSFMSQGWEVQPVASWKPVSHPDLDIVKYDVEVASPDGEFFTVQAVVTDDGGPSESAVAKGRWATVTVTATFEDAARTWLLNEETNRSDVFAIRVAAVYSDDELLEAILYTSAIPDPHIVSEQLVLVKRRSGTFSLMPVAV